MKRKELELSGDEPMGEVLEGVEPTNREGNALRERKEPMQMPPKRKSVEHNVTPPSQHTDKDLQRSPPREHVISQIHY